MAQTFNEPTHYANVICPCGEELSIGLELTSNGWDPDLKKYVANFTVDQDTWPIEHQQHTREEND